MTQSKESQFQSSDGIQFYVKAWYVDKPLAHIHLIHGLGEHVNRYDHVASFFNEHQISLTGFDLRGHGQSGGKKGHTPGYERLLMDMDEYISTYVNEGVDNIIYGHSMGGNLVLGHLLNRNANFKAAVLTSPWIKLSKEPSKLLVSAAKIINIIGGFTDSNKLDTALLATDPAVGIAYEADPLVHDKIHSKLAMGIIDMGAKILSSSSAPKVPVLLMHGNKDGITSHEASKSFAERHNNIEFKEWEGLYHEMHNGFEKEKILSFALNWLQKVL